MGTGTTWISSGLVFLKMREIDIVEAGNHISAAFEALQHHVAGIRIVSDTSAQIKTIHHQVRIALLKDQLVGALGKPADVVLSLQILCRTGASDARQTSNDTVLAHLLRALQIALHADHVIWAGHKAVLSGNEFLSATDALGTPIVKSRETRNSPRPETQVSHPILALQKIEECSERLDRQLQHDAAWAIADADQGALRTAFLDPDEDPEDQVAPPTPEFREQTPILRLSAWFISMAVALLCLPVGIALIVINLLRGENLRLANQAAALTGTFMALQAFGSVAQAATVLQTIIP